MVNAGGGGGLFGEDRMGGMVGMGRVLGRGPGVIGAGGAGAGGRWVGRHARYAGSQQNSVICYLFVYPSGPEAGLEGRPVAFS